jgi:hypothetical protein
MYTQKSLTEAWPTQLANAALLLVPSGFARNLHRFRQRLDILPIATQTTEFGRGSCRLG